MEHHTGNDGIPAKKEDHMTLKEVCNCKVYRRRVGHQPSHDLVAQPQFFSINTKYSKVYTVSLSEQMVYYYCIQGEKILSQQETIKFDQNFANPQKLTPQKC